jgi:penicillin amidase
MDGYNALAPVLVPHLLRVPSSARAVDLLRGWDHQQPADSAAAAYFNAVWRALLARTFDELPKDYKADGGDRWWEVVRGLLEKPASPWWDDRGTPAVETMDQILAAALAGAAAELSDRLGDEPSEWRWGDLHTLELRNQSFGESGVAPVEWLFNRGPEPVSGGSSIVNATGWDAASGYEVDAVPSMRMVVDLGNLDGSRWVQPGGNSGHAFSAHYADQFGPWRRGEMLPMRWDRATIRREATDTLVLKPA